MNSRITKTVALAALMAGTAGVAHATEGWYGRADVGYTFEGDSDFSGPSNFDLSHKPDWSEHLGLGYAFANGFRLEGELGHRFNQYDDGDLSSHGFTDGDVHAWSAMANLFYDFNRGGGFEPYIGVGVGAARISPTVNGAFTINDEDTRFAWQAMIGAAIPVSPQWDIDVGYRYFEADGGQYVSSGQRLPATYDMDYKSQGVTIGLRYQFAAPPPPPPPVAVACPQGDYVVYFEWDRSNLNQAALETIDAAVAHARDCNISGVNVVGHTDTSGSTQYNVGLSERRASVVRDALVARGVGTGSITTEARGEGDLARPTRDGVREPLNRRSTITITFR